MKDTRYLIAEQAQRILNGGATTSDTEVRLEELVIFVDQAFASFIKTSYFENRNDGENYVNGTFIYSFIEDVKFDKLEKITNMAFNQRRKMLRKSCKSILPILEELNIDVTKRAENLTLQEFLDISKKY